MKVPVDRLSSDTLEKVIEEFVTRDGTDYRKTEVDLETKIRQVKYQLEAGIAVLMFVEETEIVNIFMDDAPAILVLNET